MVEVEEEEQMMGVARLADCQELVLAQMGVSHSPKVKVEHGEQWVGLYTVESPLGAPETLVHVNHTSYDVPSLSSYQV